MGEWIEISSMVANFAEAIVSPFMGEWIEIVKIILNCLYQKVSPFMGEWIEIFHALAKSPDDMSHPSWVSGLK
ncbi:Uncharacterised protein [Streptococcus canis]|nr:Uncharacterised protein [Streptococcus canis]